IRVAGAGTLNVSRSSFLNNRSGGSVGGGAIAIGGGSSAVVENSTFSGSSSTGGFGGGAISSYDAANVTLTQNTFSGNSTVNTSDGGAVRVSNLTTSATLVGNILFGNTAAGAANDIRILAASTINAASGFNDIGVQSGPAVPALTPGTNGNISADPLLGALA